MSYIEMGMGKEARISEIFNEMIAEIERRQAVHEDNAEKLAVALGYLTHQVATLIGEQEFKPEIAVVEIPQDGVVTVYTAKPVISIDEFDKIMEALGPKIDAKNATILFAHKDVKIDAFTTQQMEDLGWVKKKEENTE